VNTGIVLLSIHPDHARRLLGGAKRFEFRRRAPRFETGTIALVYVTRPVGAVLGAFRVGDVHRDVPVRGGGGSLSMLLSIYGCNGDETFPAQRRSMFDYFDGETRGSAIEALQPELIAPYQLEGSAPQGWRYVRDVDETVTETLAGQRKRRYMDLAGWVKDDWQLTHLAREYRRRHGLVAAASAA
jgi:predicted transcriptional regulator